MIELNQLTNILPYTFIIGLWQEYLKYILGNFQESEASLLSGVSTVHSKSLELIPPESLYPVTNVFSLIASLTTTILSF